ncbi:MAG: TolC family protein [Bacteroidota bacterium]
MMKYLLLAVLWGVGHGVFSQSSSDTTQLQALSLERFLGLVYANHPVVQQARLQPRSADAKLVEARGQFDPKLEGSYDLKRFKDTEYWNTLNAGLKFQTWFPIDPKIEFDRNQGEFLSPEQSIPEANAFRQLTYGVSLPVGRGLIIDERRNAMKQARIYQSIAVTEQNKMLNKVLLKATKQYFDWYRTYRQAILLQNSVEIAEELFDRVVLDYGFGEAAVVDTVQALITYQTRQADYEKAKFEYRLNQLMMSQHLWSEEGDPMELQDTTIPDTTLNFREMPTDGEIQQFVQWSSTNHPEIRKLAFKLQQLEVEQQWNRESIKPQVDVSYGFIDAPFSGGGETVAPSFSDNYKLGVDVAFPIFMRKARGKLQQTQIKMEGTNYELADKRLEIKNGILAKYAETQMSRRLSQQFFLMAENYQRLLDAEFIDLEAGESNLFVLNIQQDKLIDSQVKYLENLVKFHKNKAELYFEVGILFSEVEQVLGLAQTGQ